MVKENTLGARGFSCAVNGFKRYQNVVGVLHKYSFTPIVEFCTCDIYV